MATFSAIFTPDSTQDQSATVGAGVSSAAITLGKIRKFAINASGDMNIIFGQAAVGAATASNFRIPSGVIAVYDTGDENNTIRIFNPGAGTLTYWIQFIH